MRGVFAIAAFIAVCVASLGASAGTVLRVGDQKGNARAVLEAAHALDGTAYRIEWAEFPAAAPLLEAANAGAIDAGTVGDAPFTFAAAAGVKVKAIAATRWNPATLAVLVRKDFRTQSFRDLAGKRIATGKGSIGHQLVLALLEKEGLKPSDVQLSFLSPSDAAIALQGGSVDAWATWEPYTSQLELGAGARAVAHGGKLTSGLTFFIATDAALADQAKTEALKDLSLRLAKARAWAADYIQEYAEAWSGVVGLPKVVGVRMLERQQIHVVSIDDSVIQDEQRTIDLYVRAGLLRSPINARDIVDLRFDGTTSAVASQ